MSLDHGGVIKHLPTLIKSFKFRLDTTLDIDEGEVAWDQDNGTVAIGLPGGAVVLNVGQEVLTPPVQNKTGSDITDGTPVYVSGAQGGRATVAPAQANNAMTAITFAGIATETIINNRFGYVCHTGVVNNIDTTLFDEGDIVYLSHDTPGGLSKTSPPAPNFVIGIGIVLRSNENEGAILIAPRIYPDLQRIADVSVSSESAYQVLLRDPTNQFWVNSDPKFGDTENGNYTEIGRTDGVSLAYGAAALYKDENFSSFSAGSAASAPDNIAWRGGSIYTKAFNGVSTNEQLFAGRELQHDYYEGTDLVFHIHWAPTTNDSGNVQWFIDYVIEREGSGPITSGTLSVVDAADGTAWEPTRINIGTVTGTNLLIGDQVGIRLYRVPGGTSDTYEHDAALAFTFGYHYRVNSLGSRTIGAK